MTIAPANFALALISCVCVCVLYEENIAILNEARVRFLLRDFNNELTEWFNVYVREIQGKN